MKAATMAAFGDKFFYASITAWERAAWWSCQSRQPDE